MERALVASTTASDPSRPFGDIFADTVRAKVDQISKAWRWLHSKRAARLTSKRLQVIETVALGEKRFVAVLQVDAQQFLVSSGPTGIALLASLDSAKSFGDVLKELPAPSKPGTRKVKKSAGGVP